MSNRPIQIRLENWAFCYRDRREQGKSMTGIICEDLERHAGQIRGLDEYGPRREMDENDAQLIELSVRGIRPLSRNLLRFHYMFNSPREFLCRRFKIPRKPEAIFLITLKHAEREVEQRAQVLANRRNAVSISADY